MKRQKSDVRSRMAGRSHQSDSLAPARATRGSALSSELRSALEPRFGHSFADVRVHTDAVADHMAGELNANAFTVGEDIYFDDGAFAPATAPGAQLLAHELAHVVQSSRGSSGGRAISDPADGAEHEARAAAESVLTGGTAAIQSSAGAAVARDEKNGGWSFGSLGSIVDLPGKFGALKPLGGVSSMFKAMSGFEKMAGAHDGAGLLSGGLGVGSGILGLTKAIGESTMGKTAAGAFGAVGNLVGAAGNAVDAWSNFSDGNTGAGVLSSLKATSGTLSGLSSLGGFSLGEALSMEALPALLGGGGEGLAALGPVGAVLGAGLGGYGVGTAIAENTSVGDHIHATADGLDAMLSDGGDESWSVNTIASAMNHWDKGEYLSALGDGAQVAGFGVLSSLGGFAGGAADLVDAGAGAVGDLVGSVGEFFE